MNKIFAPFLPPWVETGLQPAFYDMESGTVLQQTARMYAKVQQLTRLFNEFSEDVSNEVNNFEHDTNTEIERFEQATNDEIERFEGVVNHTVEDYIDRFVALKDFVDDYFDNLDVQEEINNKLDQMAEDGEFDEILEKYFSSYVEYITPGFVPNSFSFDANIIKYNQGDVTKFIMVDCGIYEDWYYISQMLIENNVKHLDYFVLTHYHSDHDGNIQNLITNGYIDANTTILVSCEYTDFNPDYNARMIEDLGYFTNAGLSYRTPDEGEVIKVGDLKLTFHNCTKEVIDNYSTTNPNNGSLVFLAEFNNTKALYMGDALAPVYGYLNSINFPNSSVDLFKIGHHGIESVTNNDYVYKLAPTYAIQTSGIKDFEKNNFGYCAEISILKGLNTKIYPSHMNNEYIKFVASQNNITCVQGNPIGLADQEIRQTYYVDATATNTAIQDGTPSHPFKELAQAISAVKKTNAQEITINVADGEYGVSHETASRNVIYINTGMSNRVTISGSSNTWINNFLVENSNLYIENVKIDLDNGHAIESSHCDIVLSGVTLTSKTSTGSSKYGLYLTNNTKCAITGASNIDYATDAIYCRSGSSVEMSANLTIGANVSGSIINRDTTSKVITNDYLQFTDSDMKNAFTRYGVNQYAPISIMNPHTDYATTVTMNKTAGTFDWIEIYLHTNDGKYYNTGRIYSPKDKIIGVYVSSTNNAGTHMYNKQCQLNISGSNVTITKSYQTDIDISNNTMTVSADSGNNYWNILKIVGGFKDYGN